MFRNRHTHDHFQVFLDGTSTLREGDVLMSVNIFDGGTSYWVFLGRTDNGGAAVINLKTGRFCIRTERWLATVAKPCPGMTYTITNRP